MRLLIRNLLITIVLLLFLSSFLGFLMETVTKPEEVPLSQIAQALRDDTVKSVAVRGEVVTVHYRDDTEKLARKEVGAPITQTLTDLGVTSEQLARTDIVVESEEGLGYWLAVLLPILLPIIIIGVFLWFLTQRAQQGAMQAFSFGRARARIFTGGKKERITFKDVAGVTEAKEELWEVVEFLKHPKKFLEIGARIPRGVILMGPPGTGKTLLARAVAGEANVPFFHIAGSEFVEMFVGVGASRVRDLFEQAKRAAPAIVFIDEIDAVGRMRGAGLGGGHDEREQTLNQILTEMDGFERDTNVIVVAATNRPDVLDPALLRPGRFDRRVVLDAPDIKAREEILAIHTREKKLAADINIRAIAERTPGFSGADLANLTNEAAILAARRDKKTITQQELSESIDKVILGPERKSHVFSPREKEIAAYHEAGHALVAASIPEADPIHKVSIVSRGMAGGYTQQLPSEDRKLHSKSQFLGRIATMLGGYASEGLVFNELTTGASNDLKQATDLARRLVTEYGMSDTLGPVVFSEREELIFLGRELAEQRHYSDATAETIDQEVRGIITKAHERAKGILRKKRTLLTRIAKRLTEVETLERAEFEEIIGTPHKAPVPKINPQPATP
ncbi:MAG: cell division protein FtsH [Candidatus Terrybacteria bacterium RIFCSPHIGHO2_01_FULL_58_15]|uniref:ATP-dependent zinc metalloprotease FtsH n=1 Tax=Terrybacteria sp. (strain RIFCSPHIGHO2_01_FULL_58_15) TaxID=1802363 RepID=A0A1G2PNX0_TERXR|nr:MAG: cell division protein FtsH [Candidatus Terrybacteria bacterium RIFCSPHIGHO2_01_FULL_58_15]